MQVPLPDPLPPPAAPAMLSAPSEAIWPITVTGWVSLIGTAVAILVSGLTWHRLSIQRARKEAQDEEQLNAFRVAMESTLNGFGKRVDRLESDSEEDRTTVNGVLQGMAESRAERRFFQETLQRIEQSIAETRAQVLQALIERGPVRP